MANWQTPVTNREAGAMMTVTDTNRISGNLDWLAEQMGRHSIYLGKRPSKTEWVHNDYVTLANWREILFILDELVSAAQIDQPEAGTEETTYTNINNVEDLIRRVRERYDLLLGQGANNHYTDTEVWAGDVANAGGIQDPGESPYLRIRHYVDTEIYAGEQANAGGITN